VVKDDDLAAQSIAKIQKSMVRITAEGSDLLVARGVIIDSKGTVLTDRAAITGSGMDKFQAILPSGDRVAAVVRADAATTSALAILDLTAGTTTAFAPASIADPAKLVLGQSVIRIGGKGADTVGSGVVATLPGSDTPSMIAASVTSTTPGSALITIFGEIIGIATGSSMAAGAEFYTLATVPLAATSSSKTETSS
jgi:S1-C subfamily serine protease